MIHKNTHKNIENKRDVLTALNFFLHLGVKKIILFILICLGTIAFGQNNPFDINGQKDTITQVNSNNPFDIVTTQQQIDVQTEVPEQVQEHDNPFDMKKPSQAISTSIKTIKTPKKRFPRLSKWIKKPFFDAPKLGLIAMLVCSILLAFVLNLKRDALSKVTQSCSNTNMMRLNYRNSFHEGKLHLKIFKVIFVISATVFMCHGIKYFMGYSDLKIFLVVLGLMGLLVLFKEMMISLVGWVFESYRAAREYKFSFSIFLALKGIVLIPFNILLGVMDGPVVIWLLYGGAALFLLLALIRFLQGFRIIVKIFKNNVFHFFLYLCTLEIIPFAILVKFIIDLFS